MKKKINLDALRNGCELKNSQYKIKELLGDGGFGLTYLADDRKNHRQVAIKEFFPVSDARRVDGEVMLRSEDSQASYAECWKDFQDEAKSLECCKHVGVVQKYDSFEEHSTGYLVMQFIEGQQLDDWVKQNGSDFIRQILPYILDALEYIHNQEMVHRDLKPANILVRSDNNQPILIDFGSTRLDYDRVEKSSTIPTTKAYAAPELYFVNDLGNATPATDLYALAVMLYKHVTVNNELPQEASNRFINDQLASVHNKVAPEFSCHTGLLKAIDAALIMLPKNRLQTVSEFRTLLKEDQSLDEGAASPSILIECSSEHSSSRAPDDVSIPSQTNSATIDSPDARSPSPLKKGLLILLMFLIVGAVWGYNGGFSNERYLTTSNDSDQIVNKMAQLSSLEELARDAVAKTHYSKPARKSALDYIEQIRVIAPDDVRVGELAGVVVSGYLKLAEVKLLSAPAKASLFLEQARKVALRYGLAASQTDVNNMVKRLKQGLLNKKILEKFLSEMVIIPDGSFQMGSKSFKDSIPIHVVHVNGFKMSKYELTQAQWKVVMGSNPSYIKGDDLPVTNVSWNNINMFVNKLNQKTGEHFRLPSEAEWEFAARAGGVEKWSWSNNGSAAGAYAWYKKNTDKKAHSVGQKKANTFGLYDMHGNVWEWVEDCWNDNYNDAPTNGSAWLYGTCGKRVFRGGSYNNSVNGLQPAYRNVDDIDKSYSNVGFRLVQNVSPEDVALAKKRAAAKKLIHITKLKRLARDAIAKVHYSKPAGKSALDYIEEIRAIAPDDVHPLATQVVVGYLNLVERYLNKNAAKASTYYTQARTVASAYGLNDGELLARFTNLDEKMRRSSISSDETDQRALNSLGERKAANCDAMTKDFIDHDDGTVTDKKTGLMWKKCSEGLSGLSCRRGAAHKYSWDEALQHAKKLNSDEGFSTFRDWRVPTRKELDSVYEDKCTMAVSIYQNVIFPNSTSNIYWSSTEKEVRFYYHPLASLMNPTYAFVGYFEADSGNGFRFQSAYKDSKNYVRLVRGGQ